MRTAKVSVRKFRSGLDEYIAAATPVAVTWHEFTAAYFIPPSGDTESELAAVHRASAALEAIAGPGKCADRRKTDLKTRVGQVNQNGMHG